MIVLLLGAGASKAYGDSPTGVRMPIATDFFETFEKLPISDNPWALREALFEYLHFVKGVDPYSYLKSGIDIEQLHSEIEEWIFESKKDEKPFERVAKFRPYNELVFIFAAAINEIQNGPISKAHASIAARLRDEDVVITFNWDTLMDRALASTGNWSTDSGYGFLPKSIYRDGWTAPKRNEGNSSGPRLIKLHGSTNWLTSHPIYPDGRVTSMQNAAPDTVWVFEQTVQPYPCHAGRFMPGYEDFSYGYYPPNIMDDEGKPAPEGFVILRMRPKVPWRPEGTAGDKGLVSIPLIIPPVRNKKYDFYGQLFQELWNEALEALSKADHIVIIGYSFPKTDIRTTALFKSSFMQRKSMPRISILDPNPSQIADKIRFEFGISEDHLKVYKDYFTEDFDLDKLLSEGAEPKQP
jgi:hypothetical protein